MNILTIVKDAGGVAYHRQLNPLGHLQTHYEDVTVTRAQNADNFPEELFQNYDIVQFSRIISLKEEHTKLAEKIKSYGAKVVLDIDDYWHLSANHVLKAHYNAIKYDQIQIECIKAADYITTTHEVLADQISKYNSNVLIQPNGLHFEGYPEKQVKNNRIKFGWSGSNCHVEDIELLRPAMNLLHNDPDLKEKYRVYLCGADQRDTTGAWDKYAEVFSNNATCHLDAFRVLLGRTTNEYMDLYDAFHVSLIPLNNNLFNRCKSNLKLLEAAAKRKAVIVSNVYPYSPHLKDGENCLVVNKPKDWLRHIKHLIENPEEIERLACALHADLSKEFSLNALGKTRYNHYKSMLIEKDSLQASAIS